MMTETPIAFGLTMVVCLSLFFYCWYIRKLRYRLTAVQVSATPDEVHEHTGIKKELVDTFPTVKTHELKADIKDELQCPICLVEYNDTELLRKLPFCGHVFHIHCVDSWLQKHVTCPVCRIALTEYNPKPEPNRQTSHTLQTTYCRGSSTPNSVTIEISPTTPAWVLVNRPLPLPSSTPPDSSETRQNTSLQTLETLETLDSSESGKFEIEQQLSENAGLAKGSSLLESPNAAGWGAVYLQRTAYSADAGFSFRSRAADIAIIESKECVGHASISQRWMTESFSFGISTSESGDERASSVGPCFESPDEVSQAFRSGRRRGSWRSRVVTKSWDFGRSSEDEEVVEGTVGSLLPLTVSPEQCSFEFLPVVTGPRGDYSLTDFHR